MSQSVPLASVLCARGYAWFSLGEHRDYLCQPQTGWQHGRQRILRRVRLAGAGDAFKDLGLTWPLAAVSLLRHLVVSPGSPEALGSVPTSGQPSELGLTVGCPLCLQVSGPVWK